MRLARMGLGVLLLLSVSCFAVIPARAGEARLRALAHAEVRFLVVSPSTQAGLALAARPGGPVIRQLAPRTRFGTRLVLGVVAERGSWLGVTTEVVGNGRLAWIERSPAVRVGSVGVALDVSLSARTLQVWAHGELMATFPVGIGSPESPTPTGRFAVEEKLDGAPYGGVYGCCILALSARQEYPPPGWNRAREWLIALHGGGGIGAAISAGCLHLETDALRYLMRTIPLGAPVFVEP